MKKILDACCGSKMFWFDKDNPEVEFCDIRQLDKTEYYPGRYIEIKPDTVCDFTNLPFEDNSFYLVVFDPPHLEYAGDTSIMALKYGKLKGDWKSMLSAGFDECMRVLKPNGTLIFKWSEVQIPLENILPLFSKKPLFGNKQRQGGFSNFEKKGKSEGRTHWLCFMKLEEIDVEIEKVCGTCKYNKGERDGEKGYKDWYCNNEDSDCYGVPTAYSDACEDWKGKR